MGCKENEKSYKYFNMSLHFFTLPEIKINKILTQLMKTASIIYQEITVIFCIPPTAYMNYAHSHH